MFTQKLAWMSSLILAFGLSSAAHAGVDGTWGGSLHWTDGDGRDEYLDCGLDVSQDDQTLVLEDITGQCFFFAGMLSTTFDKQDGALYLNGEEVGQVSGDEIRIASPVGGNAKLDLVVSATADGGVSVSEVLSFDDGWTDSLGGTMSAQKGPFRSRVGVSRSQRQR